MQAELGTLWYTAIGAFAASEGLTITLSAVDGTNEYAEVIL